MAVFRYIWCSYTAYISNWHEVCIIISSTITTITTRWVTTAMYTDKITWILVWNDSGYVNLTQWWYFFIIFEYILHISTPHIMIFCFPLPYFPLSQQVLYFLLSTLVHTLYIDVVLSLSIWATVEMLWYDKPSETTHMGINLKWAYIVQQFRIFLIPEQ